MGDRAAIEQFETALIGIVSPFVVVLLFNAVRSPYRIWEEQESAVRKLSVEFAEYRTASMSQLAELRSQISALSSTQWDGLRERFEKFVSHDDRFYVIFEADSCYMRGDDM